MSPRTRDRLTELYHAAHALARTPGFTISAVLTLALGIGPTAAIFTVVDDLLFRPLPYKDADRLAFVLSTNNPGTATPGNTPSIPIDKFSEWRRQPAVFEGLEAYLRTRVTWDAHTAQTLDVTLVSPNMFAFLGRSPLIGRTFHNSEAIAGADRVAVISYRLWTEAFGREPNAIGRAMNLDATSYVIVGVMPAGFSFPNRDNQVWLPLAAREYVFAIGRVHPTLSIGSATARADAIAASLERELPRVGGWFIAFRGLQVHRLSGTARRTLGMLFAAAGLVLLVASANVAGLMLSRTVARQKELGIRASLGGSPWDLLRGVLLEGVLIGLASGVLAGLAGSGLTEVLRLQIPSSQAVYGLRSVIFGFTVSLAAGAICSGLAGRRVSRQAVPVLLARQDGNIGGTRWTTQFRTCVVGVEVAATFVLVLAAALLAQSLGRMIRVEPGFETTNLATVTIRVPTARYSSDVARDDVFDRCREAIRQLPGVVEVTSGDSMPPDRGGLSPIEVDGFTASADAVTTVTGANYFATLGIPVLQGRAFGSTDTKSSAPVIAIDDRTAKRFWPGRPAVGQRLQLGFAKNPITVVAVVGHVKRGRFTPDEDRLQVYLPMAQRTLGSIRTFAVRTTANPTNVIPLIRKVAPSLDSEVTVTRGSTVEAEFAALLEVPANVARLMGLLGAGALIIAAFGIFGLLSYTITRRTREIGIRLALGADASAVVRMVLWETARPLTLGLATGIGVSIAVNRVMTSVLFELAPNDPLTTAAAIMLMMVTAGLVAWLPARRATRIDPVAAMRN